MNLCRHCQVRKVNRPKGLCCSCYDKPDVRALYPSTSIFVRGDNQLSSLATCAVCKHMTGMSKSAVRKGKKHKCSTCQRPQLYQPVYQAHLAEYERKAALGLPLFDVA